MPRFTRWQHLCLECKGIMDVLFEDASTFGEVRPTHSIACLADAPCMHQRHGRAGSMHLVVEAQNLGVLYAWPFLGVRRV